MATRLVRGRTIRLKAYAGVDPATGKGQYLYDQVPATAGKREVDRAAKALDARAQALAESRRARRRDPNAVPKKAAVRADKTIGDAVEAWWKHHGSKLPTARHARGFIDGIILPHLGAIKIALVAGTPPDDDDERDDDLVYLSEKWAEIQRVGRRVGDKPLEASYIHRCHGIVGAALRRAGRPIADPGLPSVQATADATPLPEEMVAFLPHLAAPGRTAAYTVTRRVRGGPGTTSYIVPARDTEPSAMDLMLNAFALLVGNGPRPVEAAAITRTQVDFDTKVLSLDARGVVQSPEPGPERWVIVTGETAKRRRRAISLDDRTLAALKRWFAWQRDYALRCGERLTARSLVFSLAPDGSEPISPKVFSGNFTDAVRRARGEGCDLPDGFHLYSMRHFGITQLLRNGKGRNVAAVADRFGTSTRMIEERYEHAIPKDDAHLAEILGAVWGEADPGGGDVIPISGGKKSN
ncbi:MAG TPA: site-specific integrase [Actinomycetota bacterium]|nr:site-specific integrase [Actinomycetota bacterium]